LDLYEHPFIDGKKTGPHEPKRADDQFFVKLKRIGIPLAEVMMGRVDGLRAFFTIPRAER
jgi:hypothetical protein